MVRLNDDNVFVPKIKWARYLILMLKEHNTYMMIIDVLMKQKAKTSIWVRIKRFIDNIRTGEELRKQEEIESTVINKK